jgi:nicotinate-nucleotide pyrophosphorylase (carboxylating)
MAWTWWKRCSRRSTPRCDAILIKENHIAAAGGIRMLADTGIECVSMGALTHSAPALDLSLIVEAQP